MMEWFRHDVNAHDDIKIKKLLKKHGFSALGVYWFIVEILFTNDGRLEYADAVDEVCLVDGLTEEDAIAFIDLLLDLKLLYMDGSALGSHRVDTEFTLNEELRQKKIEAGRKGGIAKASNAKALSSTATSRPSNANSKASTLQDNTRQDNTDSPTYKKTLRLNYNLDNPCKPAETHKTDSPKKGLSVGGSASKTFITIISNKGEEVPITEDLVEMWQKTYPAVSVKTELLRMKSWAISNPTMRKTRQGMTRFCDNWLKKEQDKSGMGNSAGSYRGKAFRPTDLNGQYDDLPPVEVVEA